MNSPKRARVLADNDWNDSESLKYYDCIFLNHIVKVKIEEDGSLLLVQCKFYKINCLQFGASESHNFFEQSHSSPESINSYEKVSNAILEPFLTHLFRRKKEKMEPQTFLFLKQCSLIYFFETKKPFGHINCVDFLQTELTPKDL